MAARKGIDRVCLIALAVCLLATAALLGGAWLGLWQTQRTLGYEDRLFDTSTVHTIDIEMEDWDGFIAGCEDEEYVLCDLVIDGERYDNVAIRAKGNTSLSSVSALGSERYSFKVEFDHYDSGTLYHGLDKLCLNNIIQDNTYMKDYLTYQMMAAFGVKSPLCSYAYLTVNGADWGLYLAVEGVEDAFLQRNYGSVSGGELYKPDSVSLGAGPGNGADFTFPEDTTEGSGLPAAAPGAGGGSPSGAPDDAQPPGQSDDGAPPDLPEGAMETDRPDDDGVPDGDWADGDGVPTPGNGTGGAMASSDVLLQYIDDDPESYSNIFENAKTDVTQADKARLIASLKALGEGEDLEQTVDVEQVIRYFVVHNFVVNGDSYTGGMVHNYYLYEENGQLSMIPWDYNLAFGAFQASDAESAVNDPIDTPLSVAGDGSRPMIDWILSDETYLQLYHAYFAEFLETVDVQDMIEETAALIAPYVQRDPTKFCTYEAFETGVEALQTFCALRTESVLGQLEGRIPSTAEGQGADADALVDAGTLDLADMGSMNTAQSPAGGGAMPGGEDAPSGSGGFAPGNEAAPGPEGTATAE